MCKKGKGWEKEERLRSYRDNRGWVRNHEAIIFISARGRVLRSSTLGQWTKEEYERARRKNEKKKQAGGETREEGLASSSGKVRDKDVKVV